MGEEIKNKVMKKRLGELLLEAGLIDELQLAVALGSQKSVGGRLGAELIRLGFIEEEELRYVLQNQMGIEWVTLRDKIIPANALEIIPAEMALKYTVMPLAYDGKTLTLATTDPSDLQTIDTISFVIGKNVRPVMALEYDIKKTIASRYDKAELEALGIDLESYMASSYRTKDATDFYHNVDLKEKEVSESYTHAGSRKARTFRNAPIDLKLDALISLLIENNIISGEALSKKLRNLKK